MSKTTSWSPSQQAWVDEWIIGTADDLSRQINGQARLLTAKDDRPKQIWTEDQPDVFFPYAAQGLLEDLITELQSRV